MAAPVAQCDEGHAVPSDEPPSTSLCTMYDAKNPTWPDVGGSSVQYGPSAGYTCDQFVVGCHVHCVLLYLLLDYMGWWAPVCCGMSVHCVL
jgi:hypothetical protein